MKRAALMIAAAVILIGCNALTSDLPQQLLEIPVGFPDMPMPSDNPLSAQKIALGKRLFYDPILSLDSSVSCASCHKQEHGFADTKSTSSGVKNETGVRNALAIANAGYLKALFYDGRAASLDEQIMGAITNPIEMHSDAKLIATRLQNHPKYPQLLREAFGETADIDTRNAVKAIASFVRTIVSGNSRYDNFMHGDSSALTAQQRRGMTLFFSNRTNCAVCHSGYNFTDEKFHSTGISSHYFDGGRYEATHNEDDRGLFRTPTLRNVALTAPYMHNGEFFTLDRVLELYSRGGRSFVNKDSLIVPLNLNNEEKSDIIAFLQSLTDEKMLTNSKYAKP